MDDLTFDNLGFIHSDAQGSDNIIFWGGRETISKFKPIIFYEDSKYDDKNNIVHNFFLDRIKQSYDIPTEALTFDVGEFCVNELGYKTWKAGYSSYLIP
jgi:hypothetical protein